MPKHEDKITEFIPEGKTNLVIMGTMAAMNARYVNDVPPEKDAFFYNDNRNNFWEILQFVFEPDQNVRGFEIPQKKEFLERNGIAICNIVSTAIVPPEHIAKVEDDVLFRSYQREKVTFKTVSPEFRALLQSHPVYFTCRGQKKIKQFLCSFFKTNSLNEELAEDIWYLLTPTRCNAYNRAQEWKEDIEIFLFFRELIARGL